MKKCVKLSGKLLINKCRVKKPEYMMYQTPLLSTELLLEGSHDSYREVLNFDCSGVGAPPEA